MNSFAVERKEKALNDRLECVWGNVCVRVEKKRRNGLRAGMFISLMDFH